MKLLSTIESVQNAVSYLKSKNQPVPDVGVGVKTYFWIEGEEKKRDIIQKERIKQLQKINRYLR